MFLRGGDAPGGHGGRFLRTYPHEDVPPRPAPAVDRRTARPLDSDEEENAALTLSTWGLSEKEFFEVTSDWLGWWQGLVEGGEAVVN